MKLFSLFLLPHSETQRLLPAPHSQAHAMFFHYNERPNTKPIKKQHKKIIKLHNFILYVSGQKVGR
jgi:hypothetical protein